MSEILISFGILMKVNINSNENFVDIKIKGKYDIEELLFFSTLFTDEISKKPPVIALDLMELTYIDSSGIGSLIRYMNMAGEENIVFLCYNLNKNIENIFKISKLDQFIPILSIEDFKKKYKLICFSRCLISFEILACSFLNSMYFFSFLISLIHKPLISNSFFYSISDRAHFSDSSLFRFLFCMIFALFLPEPSNSLISFYLSACNFLRIYFPGTDMKPQT